MYQLKFFFTEYVTKSKFVKEFKIPRRIVAGDLNSNYIYKQKYGGYGIVFLYTHHVIKLIIAPDLKNVNRYIKPELNGIDYVKSNKNFVSCYILNEELEAESEFMKTSIEHVYYYKERYFAMILMKRYTGDIYKPIIENMFNYFDKQELLRFVVKTMLSLLEDDLLYGDLKMEQILYKINKRQELVFKFGDFGSLTTLNFSKVNPTYTPVRYMRKFNLTTIQVFLFSLGNLWFDLYRDHYDEDQFYLSYDKINYDDSFNYNIKRHIDKISVDMKYMSAQKKIVLRWLTSDLKTLFVDVETNKNELRLELLAFLSVNRHYYYTKCNKPETNPLTRADTFL